MKKRNAWATSSRSDLTTAHTQAHWRRILAAKARTDMSTPESFQHSLEVRTTLQKKDMLAGGRKSVRDDGRTNKDQKHPCQLLVLFDRTHLGEKPQSCTSPHRWCLYHTATGRAAGYCQELWKNHLNTTLSPPSLHLSPWKPAFTISSRTPLPSSFSPDTTSHHSPRGKSHSVFTSTGYIGDVVAIDSEKMILNESFPVVFIYDERRDKLNQSRILEESGLTHDETQLKESPTPANSTSYKHYLVEKNNEMRRRLEESARESEYLDFVSTVTKDIVTRGITTKAGLESLFASHVNKNKHQLREDILWQKLSVLKNDLAFD